MSDVDPYPLTGDVENPGPTVSELASRLPDLRLLNHLGDLRPAS